MVKKDLLLFKIFKHLIMNFNTICVCVYRTMGISILYLNILINKIGLAQVITKHLIHFAHYSPSILFHNFHSTQFRGEKKKKIFIKLLIVAYWTNWTHKNLAYMTNIKLVYQSHQLKQTKKGKKKEENGKCDL